MAATQTRALFCAAIATFFLLQGCSHTRLNQAPSSYAIIDDNISDLRALRARIVVTGRGLLIMKNSEIGTLEGDRQWIDASLTTLEQLQSEWWELYSGAERGVADPIEVKRFVSEVEVSIASITSSAAWHRQVTRLVEQD